jgi:hypothetical protein
MLFIRALLFAVQASIAANTWVVSGASQTKSKSGITDGKKNCVLIACLGLVSGMCLYTV